MSCCIAVKITQSHWKEDRVVGCQLLTDRSGRPHEPFGGLARNEDLFVCVGGGGGGAEGRGGANHGCLSLGTPTCISVRAPCSLRRLGLGLRLGLDTPGQSGSTILVPQNSSGMLQILAGPLYQAYMYNVCYPRLSKVIQAPIILLHSTYPRPELLLRGLSPGRLSHHGMTFITGMTGEPLSRAYSAAVASMGVRLVLIGHCHNLVLYGRTEMMSTPTK